MNKKTTGKIARIGPEITDAELVPSPSVAETVKETLQASIAPINAAREDMAAKQAQLEIITSTLLKKHTENGSLAFELLKSSINQPSDLIHRADFALLIKNTFDLIDQFKAEVDARWDADVKLATNQVLGTQAANSTVN